MSKIAQLEKKVKDMQAEINKLHLEEHKVGHGNCPHCGVCKCCGRYPTNINYWPQWYFFPGNPTWTAAGTIQGNYTGYNYTTSTIDVTTTAIPYTNA